MTCLRQPCLSQRLKLEIHQRQLIKGDTEKLPITQIRHGLKIMCNKEIGHVHFMLKLKIRKQQKTVT